MTASGSPNATGAKPINLALQGGGAHGAFTWGVLDCLLEDNRVAIEAISGTSAGAMNAVVLADGLMEGGPEGARRQLRQFWQTIAERSGFSLLGNDPFSAFMRLWGFRTSPAYHFVDGLTRTFSPYEFNPLNVNPLTTILGDLVDFDRVRACEQLKLFVSATNVETGRVRVFPRETLTIQMVMASAALPTLFQAVQVDDKFYWDGGYMGNPVLFPFFHASASPDIMIVQINPIERRGVPKTAPDILNRINEISFNASLLNELRAVDFVRRMLKADRLSPDDYREMYIHIIDGEQALADLGAPSKLNAERVFLEQLFEMGRAAARNWLDAHYEALGARSTVDIRRLFQGDGYEREPKG
jgi:NTE family protein